MKDPSNPKVVTQRTLELYEKYDRDFGLLDERWASKKDRDSVSNREAQILGEYVDHLHYLKGEHLSEELRKRFMDKIVDLKPYIEDQVIEKLEELVNQT